YTYPTPDLIHIKLKVKIRIHPPLHISSTVGFDIITYLLQMGQTTFKFLKCRLKSSASAYAKDIL
ncbi:hypothetical protein, partial [Neisseria meningitidis]|uniref:hypothetical protein n=1 Tax=Neisseria meningitidis TaxID=487 RepID=UPI001E63E6C6